MNFKVYTLAAQYAVLKCPHCQHKFRYSHHINGMGFGNEITNASCQSCNKKFSIKENFLKTDSLGKPWAEKERIVIDPDGKVSYLREEKIDLPPTDFKDAGELL